MQKLSLLMFAILILGCGTETPVVEEPEEPPPVIEETPPVVMEPELSHHPLIGKGDVKHGQVNVDPEPFNRGALHFSFKEPFNDVWVSLKEKDGNYLGWYTFGDDGGAERQLLIIEDYLDRDPLEYDTEYELMITVQHFNCETTEIVIQFRTKPQRPVVGRPAPVIQERIPSVALGEHFQLFDIVDTRIIDGDVPTLHEGRDIDPEPLNVNGIQFEFNLPIREYEIDLRVKDGGTLAWLPRGLVDNDMGERIQITPAEGFPLLEFDTEYVINIFVLDSRCLPWRFDIQFRTKRKP